MSRSTKLTLIILIATIINVTLATRLAARLFNPPPILSQVRIPGSIEPFKCAVETTKFCVVQSSPGGYLLDHKIAADWIIHRRQRVIVDGLCASACTLLVDQAHQAGLVCVTPNARLLYHLGRVVVGGKVRSVDIAYTTPALRTYVAGAGGLPWDSWLEIKGETARLIYPSCERIPRIERFKAVLARIGAYAIQQI